jgi:hypothetical protein
MSVTNFPLPKANTHAGNPRRSILLLSILLVLAFLIGCGSSSPQGDAGQNQPGSSASGEKPDITDETIRERIYDTRVRNIPEENGAGDPITWNFFMNEPLEIHIVDKQVNGTHATLILDIKTGSAPGTRNPRQLAGQIRTDWQLETGWVLRRWEIVNTENISMKYKNLPKPPAANNSNQ